MTCRTLLPLLLLTVASPALGQSSNWVPVLVASTDTDSAALLTTQVTKALRTEHDVAVLEPSAAAARVERAHSLQEPVVDLETLKAHARHTSGALQQAHLNHWPQAAEHATAFSALPHIEQDLVRSRDPQVGRDLLDYCLKLAEHRIGRGEQEDADARRQLQQCLRRVPNQLPGEYDATSARGKLYTEVRESLPKAQLRLDVPDDCVAHVNGEPRSMPLETIDVRQRVQLRCGSKHGRIYNVQPGAVVIDQHIDSVLKTDRGSLRLQYDSPGDAAQRQLPDGLSVARSIGATDLLLVATTPTGRTAFSRVDVALEQVLAEVSLPADASSEQVLAAAASLTGQPAPPQQPMAMASDSQDTGAALWPGLALATGSLAAYATGWTIYVAEIGSRDILTDFGPCAAYATPDELVMLGECLARSQRHADLGDFGPWFGLFGAGLGIAAFATLLPEEPDGAPLWSWLVGAAGAGTIAIGASLWASSSSCGQIKACEPDEHNPSLGQLIALQGAPLLAVPLTYVVRGWLQGDVQLEVHASHDGASITVGGAL